MTIYTPQTWTDGPGGGTPTSAARLAVMEAGIADASAVGRRIDVAKRSYSFDVHAVSTTATEVEGLTLVVPAGTRPYDIIGTFLAQFSPTASAVAGTQETIALGLNDYTTGTDVPVFSTLISCEQPTAAARSMYKPVGFRVSFEATTTRKVYRVTARTLAAAAANWTSALFAQDIPVSGSYPPMQVEAVTT